MGQWVVRYFLHVIWGFFLSFQLIFLFPYFGLPWQRTFVCKWKPLSISILVTFDIWFLSFGLSRVIMKAFSKLDSFHLHTSVSRTNSTSFPVPGLRHRGRRTNIGFRCSFVASWSLSLELRPSLNKRRHPTILHREVSFDTGKNLSSIWALFSGPLLFLAESRGCLTCPWTM